MDLRMVGREIRGAGAFLAFTIGLSVSCLIAGFAIGRAWGVKPGRVDPAAPEVKHPGGAVTLRVDPSVPAPPPLVKGKRRTSTAMIDLPALQDPTRLQVDITEEEGAERVTVKLPDGQELAGVQIPTAPRFRPPREYRNEVMIWKEPHGEVEVAYSHRWKAIKVGVKVTDRGRVSLGGGITW